jgi:hypothetical protein
VRYLKNTSSGAVGTATAEEMHFLRERAPGLESRHQAASARAVLVLLAAGADLVGTTVALAIVAAGAEPVHNPSADSQALV